MVLLHFLEVSRHMTVTRMANGREGFDPGRQRCSYDRLRWKGSISQYTPVTNIILFSTLIFTSN